MANWYYTDFTIIGEKADVDAVEKLLDRLVDARSEIQLTDIAEALGCDLERTFCAGCIVEDTLMRFPQQGDTARIDFATETKWQPPYQIVHELCSRYASLQYYFMAYLAEEYLTNDAEGRFYPERVYVELTQGDTTDEQGFLTIGEALAWIGESTGRQFASEEEVKQYFDSLDAPDSYCIIRHVRVIGENEQLTFLPQDGTPDLLLLTPDLTPAGEIKVTYPSAESKD